VKLAVSNIAWDEPEQPEILAAFPALGVTGIEIAPTKLWPDWRGADPAAGQQVRHAIEAKGLCIPAIQSVLFGLPDLQLFGSADCQTALVKHLTEVAKLAGALGAEAIVFGSPRNRDRGELSLAQAMDRAVPVLRQVGEACAAAGTCFCLEPNPEAYNCNFLTHWQDVAELAERVGHPGVGIHLDTACITLAEDDPVEAIAACGAAIRHFHVSEPALGAFTNPVIGHGRIGAALRSSGYSRFVSIEMRRQPDPVTAVREAVACVMANYA
jgi:D-psicose/D-tagatose/L-ribulose 3-epimerase